MIDREKVLTVLQKRFPDAALSEIAAAANAIVGLEPEFVLLPANDLHRFHCEAGAQRFTTRDVATGDLRLYRRARAPRTGPVDARAI
jgi:hypothetical protein